MKKNNAVAKIKIRNIVLKTVVYGSVFKADEINKEIKKHEKELERLFTLLKNVSGKTVDVCPQCKTKNYHWSINNKWCCAFC